MLEWDGDENTSTYDIYKDYEVIANITETSYIVKDLSLGWHCFKVIGVNGIKQSPASEIECVELETGNGDENGNEDGVEELSSSLLLYPNPVNDKLNIVTEVEVEEVVVYDVFGRQRTTDNRQQTSSIDVSMLNNGVYFVMIKTNDGVVMKRFVKK